VVGYSLACFFADGRGFSKQRLESRPRDFSGFASHNWDVAESDDEFRFGGIGRLFGADAPPYGSMRMR
jgi:hypothetical protein